jgi:nuclear receptor subfamily 2 group E protein 1
MAAILFTRRFLLTDVDSGSSSSSTTKSSTPCSDDRTLVDAAAVAALQDHTQLTLSKYIITAHPGQPLRFGKLLLLLPTLRTVSAATIEELFFRRTIGNIPIERIICDMYKTSDI